VVKNSFGLASSGTRLAHGLGEIGAFNGTRETPRGEEGRAKGAKVVYCQAFITDAMRVYAQRLSPRTLELHLKELTSFSFSGRAGSFRRALSK